MNNSSGQSRPRTPSRSPAPPSTTTFAQPPIPPNPQEVEAKPPSRKASFNFLRRGKSVEKMNGIKRTISSGKLRKKSKHDTPEPIPIPVQPPKIPDLVTQPKIQEFGGGDSSKTRLPYNVPIPRVPAGLEDQYSRSESMTNRGRYSYASSAVSTLNSPRRVRRRKDPTPFNILIVGARNSGKSSFGEFLRASLALPPRKQRPSYYPHDDGGDVTSRQTPNFRSEFLETEIAGERIGLTIWDSEGLEISIVDLQLREIVTFIESKFDETLTEETKVIRSPGVKDPHIHCVLLLLDPVNLNKTISDAKKKQEAAINGNLANGKSFLTDASPDSVSALDENMDLQVLRVLQGKTTVIPIISKADTITSEQMKLLKHAVYREIKTAKLDPFEVLGVEESEEEEDDSSSDADDREILQQHDHRRFREADEDEYRAQHDPEKSTFDLSDSSSEGSVIRRKNGNPSTKQEENTLPPLPLSVLTPEPITVHQPLIGATSRSFPWGSADPYNPKHCDFVRFKEAVFQEWFVELREASHELWYEGWRTSRLDAPRARTITLSPTPMPTQEPTIPILATNSKGPLAASSAQMTSKQSSRNVSAVYSPSPIAAQKQTQYLSPQQSYSPAQQQRSNPHSPSFNSPQELSASPVPSYRGSPQPIPLVSPQPSQNMSYQKQSQPSAQQQQLLQQQQQQSSQRGNSPFSVPHQQQGRQTPSKSPSTERQEVGVAR